MLPPLREHFAGKTLLVTGATGFLAKALLAKLLRDLPELERVLLLLRPRVLPGGDRLSSAERLQREVLASSAFRAERARLGDDFAPATGRLFHAVEGDLGLDGLGLSDRCLGSLRGVDLIVNSAACVAFDEALDLALEVNTFGPSRLLALAAELERPFLHVSTAYVCGRVEGLVPEAPPDPSRSAGDDREGREDGSLELDALVDSLRADALHARARGESAQALAALGMDRARELGWNDTYTFTKALGERLLVRDRGRVVVGLLRPSIIESAIREPEPGWIDCLRMADPIFAAHGRGVLREFPADPDCTVDFVPVDHVVNALLAAGALLGHCPPSPTEPVPTWHVATSGDNPLTARRLFSSMRAHFREQPFRDASGRAIEPARWGFATEAAFRRGQGRRRLRLGAASRFLQLLPARFGRSWRRKVARGRAGLEYLDRQARLYGPYCSFGASFATARARALHGALDPADRQDFGFDSRTLAWEHYLRDVHLPGLRRNVLREATQRNLEPLFESGGKPHGLFDLLESSASEHAGGTALRVRREGRLVEWSLDELLSAALRAASRLRELGVETGDRVLLQAENAPEWAIAYFGILAAGGVAVPLDPQTLPTRRDEIRRFTQSRVSILSKDVEAAGRCPDEEIAALSELGSPGQALGSDFLPSRRGGAEPASILFTSGTTLEPKGVVLSHRAFLANVDSVVRALAPGPRDRIVSVLPLHHAFEFTAGLLAPLTQGASITYLARLTASDLLEELRLSRATALLGVPRLFELLLDGIRRNVGEAPAVVRVGLSAAWRLSAALHGRGWSWGRLLLFPVHARFGGRLRFLVSGGAALPPAVQREFAVLGFRLLEGYGLTETAPVLAVNPLDEQRAGSVGRALPGVELRVDEPGPDGVGEILARGDNLMCGYYRDPEATRAVLREGWLRTGDLGRFDDEGFLYVTGRLKDLIVTPSGKNVHPDEVEAALDHLPGVVELCVVGAPNRSGTGEEVHLVVVPSEPGPEAEEAIRRSVRDRLQSLPSHQQVSLVHFRSEELPRTRLQKVQRSKLRTELRTMSSVPRTDRVAGAEGNPRAERVLSLLARLTGRPASELSPSQDLVLELGVDSLMAAELLAAAGGLTDEGRPRPEAAALRTVGELLELAKAGAALPEASSRGGRPEETDGRPGPAARLFAATAAPFVRAASPLLYGAWLHLEVSGLENLPATGPYILAANHASHLDAGLVLSALGKRASTTRVVAARDYFFDNPWKAAFFERVLRAIPFERHGDWEGGLAACRSALEAGEALLIFPEGTRSTTGSLQAFKPGVGRLAAEMGVPIVPTRVEGTHEALPKGGRLPKRRSLAVRFGVALHPSGVVAPAGAVDYERWRLLTAGVREAIEGLAPEGGVG